MADDGAASGDEFVAGQGKPLGMGCQGGGVLQGVVAVLVAEPCDDGAPVGGVFDVEPQEGVWVEGIGAGDLLGGVAVAVAIGVGVGVENPEALFDGDADVAGAVDGVDSDDVGGAEEGGGDRRLSVTKRRPAVIMGGRPVGGYRTEFPRARR